jgi:hypothetical protein
MAIIPDSKNWTWVLDRPCTECGFDASALDYDAIPSLIRADVASWIELLNRPESSSRPDDGTWSTLEYSAHVRDVHRIFLARLELVLTQDNPEFENWDQDATAVADNYAAQNPLVVGEELAAAAEAAARGFAAVPTELRQRAGLRSDGSRFTVETLARYYAHDPIHHLWDVRR